MGSIFRFFVLSLTVSICASCGGGGGGSDFVGAALVSVSATPNRIDTGDRTQLRVDISDVHPDGIALKIRFPSGLSYFSDTAFIKVNGQELNVSPQVNATSRDLTYLVFYFDQNTFGSGNSGVLSLELEGISRFADGLIEIDPDVDDSTIPNTSEFDIESPEFEAQADTFIAVGMN